MPPPHVLQMGPLPDKDETPLQQSYYVHRYFEAEDKSAFLARVGPSIRGIATSGHLGVDPTVLAACQNVEVIAVYGVGYDAIDLSTCRARGIRLANTPDVLTDDCADLALAMWLALSRGLVGADAWARSGRWALQGKYPLQRRASGKRAGILGLGRIGAAIGRRLEGFGMKISYSARSPRPKASEWSFVADPVALAARSDVLFVALAASPQTRHIVDARVIDALGSQGLLVNISRAQNIDEHALLDALEAKKLGGAALDVFEGEPRLNPRFADLTNVLLQPHHASGTVETRQAMGQLMRDNLAAHFAGQPLLTPVML